MNRTGFFGRILQAVAVPATIALGRAMPSAPIMTGYGIGTAETVEGAAADFEIPAGTAAYAMEYANGPLSLIRFGSITERILRDAFREPGVVRVVEFVRGETTYSQPAPWIYTATHLPIGGP